MVPAYMDAVAGGCRPVDLAGRALQPGDAALLDGGPPCAGSGVADLRAWAGAFCACRAVENPSRRNRAELQ